VNTVLRLAAWIALGVVSTLPAACGTGSSESADGPTVAIVERDFEIKAPKRIPSGPVLLEVENQGPIAHELAVVRDIGGDVRLGPNGLTIDEEWMEPREVDELEPEDPGLRTMQLNLRPGRYLLLCNMTGHYLGGMHTEVLVR
jgi:uncharacterized cupredoxin-like copper-binding protein